MAHKTTLSYVPEKEKRGAMLVAAGVSPIVFMKTRAPAGEPTVPDLRARSMLRATAMRS